MEKVDSRPREGLPTKSERLAVSGAIEDLLINDLHFGLIRILSNHAGTQAWA
jgi:hypothetical protein